MRSPYILRETERVLRYSRMQSLWPLSSGAILEYVRALEASADVVTPFFMTNLVPGDPDDDPVLATALTGRADILCTRDRHFQDAAVVRVCHTASIRLLTDVELLRCLCAGLDYSVGEE